MTHRRNTRRRKPLRLTVSIALVAALGACSGGLPALDWDLRRDGAGTFSTADAARNAAPRPEPDVSGVISYPDYQVAVARPGDSVASVATRVGLSPDELAAYNALAPDAPLNPGEVLALPRRVATPQAGPAGAPIQSGTIEVSTLASGAIERAESGDDATATSTAIKPGGVEPVRHRVERGETAYSIARLYSVSAKTIAEWNGLGPDLAVREGQYLLVPVSLADSGDAVETVTAPGEGSPTPPPPSAATPLPEEQITAAAQPAPDTPPSPDLAQDRSGASAARFAMPADGSIIRGFAAKANPGIDIGAAAGSPVRAAADGTVAAITQDTGQVPILVLRHADNILTVYANIDGIAVAKGDQVTRGQTIAAVRAGSPAYLHFEVRNGIDAVDPTPYLE